MSRARDIASIGSDFGSLATDAELATAVSEIPTGGKNLLYNGAMQVAQRGTSTASITGNGIYTADRWSLTNTTLGTWTQSVETDAPTGIGFTKSLKMLCTTADAAPGAGDQLRILQALEGQDVQRLAKGTSNAAKLTLSFWVKSNVTGTYVAQILDSDNSRMICATYSISASATWEKKTLSFVGDTTGVFDNDNNASLYVIFYLGAGTNFTSGTLQTTWGSSINANRAVGQTNVAAATDNYWQITGVQLEVGDTATEFEHLPFGVELARCQRYYYRVYPNATSRPLTTGGRNTLTTSGQFLTPFPVPMRSAPTALEQSGVASHYEIAHSNSSTQCSAVPTHGASTTSTIAVVNADVASGLTAGQSSYLRTDGTNGASAYLAWSAEL